MHKRLLLALFALTLVWPSALPLFAQSLADVAAAEASRRKAQTVKGKVYTNEDLSGTMQEAATLSAPAPQDAAQTPGARPASAATPGAAAPPKTATVDEKKTEAYWKGRVTVLQQGLARSKVLIEAMQSRINALNAEALSADDPGRYATLQANLTTAVSEMGRLKEEAEKQNKDLAAVEEEARRANIPPGWLR